MSAYEGEFIYLFQHYRTACQLETLWQSATLHKKRKTSQWTEMCPLTHKGWWGAWSILRLSEKSSSGLIKGHLIQSKHAASLKKKRRRKVGHNKQQNVHIT